MGQAEVKKQREKSKLKQWSNRSPSNQKLKEKRTGKGNSVKENKATANTGRIVGRGKNLKHRQLLLSVIVSRYSYLYFPED